MRNPLSAMAKFELTAAADRDLTEIYVYSHRRFGERQADEYLLGLGSCFSKLAEMPDMGHSIEDIRAEYYRFAHARHVIFYRKIEEGVRIVRVLHIAMEPERHL
jgi:toxin ParE1/3/4